MHEFKLQGIQGIPWRSEEHKATCGLVQTMHRLQPRLLFTGFVDKVPQIERLVKINVRPMHQQPVGFDYGRHVLVRVQQAKRRFCTFAG